ncbi:glycosyltransferase family 2 protein [Flavobacterium sp. H122]|uniref:glycosyltransferase family 2 protein n=1 Tax=Flavobacterium sp. H122 TaxID=2529860 RepID=UPI0010AA9E43|nr:glycosyltransferase family 2 protein [Flavobacterium sp. H122]
MKKIAVVILNWNGKKLLEQFLPSVVQYSQEAVIYVADNASTDDSVQFVKNQYPSIKIIQNSGNFGYAKGYNEALQFVEEEIYALVNSDIEVTENWLQPIIELFSDEKVAIAQPKILDYKDKKMFEYAGAAGGFIDKYGFPFCRGRIFETLEEDKGQYNDIIDIFWATGACLFIRKDVFRELKGFDSDFFAHQEEIDLCWRAHNKGYLAKYCGKSTVYHVGGATLQTGSPMKTFLNFRNSLWMMLKNLPARKLFPVLLFRLMLDGAAGLKFLTEGKPKHFWAVLKSHFYFYIYLNNYLSKRGLTQQENYYKIKSVVYRYFVKNGKLFADL